MKQFSYQPKTGARCTHRNSQERDNCPRCEGTGMVIDFAVIRARNQKPKPDPLGPLTFKVVPYRGYFTIKCCTGSKYGLMPEAQANEQAQQMNELHRQKWIDLSLEAAGPEMLSLLCANLLAWDNEEDSVKEEHAELIGRTREMIERLTP